MGCLGRNLFAHPFNKHARLRGCRNRGLLCRPWWEVAFSDQLKDLDWGSWEGLLPESSSLGGDGTPLRGAFTKLRGFQELTAERTLSVLRSAKPHSMNHSTER